MAITSTMLTSIEAEQTVLGALLADTGGTLLPTVSVTLKPEHFSEPLHARIYEAATKLWASGGTVSAIGLKVFFEQDETLNEIGGMAYLSRLVANACPSISLKSHVELLRDLAARREAVAAAGELTEMASHPVAGESFRPSLAAHIENLQRLFDDGGSRKTTYSVGDAGSETVERIRRIRNGETDRNAIRTGIEALDRYTGGLHRGEYIILGGRPSMGKTAVACQLAYNVAERNGGVFYGSLEMPVSLLMPRLLSCRLWTPGAASSTHYERIRRGDVSDQEMRWIESASQEMKTWPFIIDDAPGLSAVELEARAQVAKARLERNGRSLDLIVVDHLHKMRHPGAQSKVTEYTEISGRLAEMAKRLDCPVLALAQLNRSVESRDNKRPQLADLRESGSIEQDADTVLFTYRPAYYLERKRCDDPRAEAERMADLDATGHILEILIEKQRSGPIGTVELWCDMAANVVRDPADVGEPMEMAA